MINDQIIECVLKSHCTPFYALDIAKVNENMKNLKHEFMECYGRTEVGYSYKTNYCSSICEAAKQQGLYAEVVSYYEYVKAQKNGVNGNRIIWNGPGKKQCDVSAALLNNSTVNADSVEEFEMLARVKAITGNAGRIGIRVCLDSDVIGDSRFGVEAHEAVAVKEIAKKHGVKVNGIHCHVAHARRVEEWQYRTYETSKIAEMFDDIEYVDLGGGMYGKMDDELAEQFTHGWYEIPSFRDYAKTVGGLFKCMHPNEDVELIIEPGTALVADTMCMVSSVTGIKKRNGKKIAFLDCSSFDTGFVGRYKDVPAHVLHRKAEAGECVLTGCTCIEKDIVKKRFGYDVHRGDVIVFTNAGAYSNNVAPDFIKPANDIVVIDVKEIPE